MGLILAVDRLPARDVRLPVTPSPRSTGRCFGTPATGPDTRTPRRLGELQSRIHAAPLSGVHGEDAYRTWLAEADFGSTTVRRTGDHPPMSLTTAEAR